MATTTHTDSPAPLHTATPIRYNWTIPLVWAQIQADSDYAARKASVATFNTANKWKKKGIALSPVKYVMQTSYYRCVHPQRTIANILNDNSFSLLSGHFHSW